jgi:PIN domain nuclease of toxin-antitoxin system
MKLVLDSHAFIWSFDEQHKLSIKVTHEILSSYYINIESEDTK